MGDVPTTRFARSDGGNIAYQVFGEGDLDVLMFSGAVLSIDSMDDEPALARFVRRLASFSRLIRFDVRGLGLSDPVPASAPPSLEDWMRDALAVLDDCGSQRAAVFTARGPSLEGILLTASHPERITHLVVVNGQARLAEAPDYPIGVPQTVLDGFLATNTAPDAVEQGFDILSVAAPSIANDDAFRRWWIRAGNRAASPAMAHSILRVVVQADVRAALPLVRSPTLVLHRRGDAFIPARHGRYLAEHIPDARYVELPGADDLYWVGDDTSLMLEEIEEFLTGVRPTIADGPALATVLFTDIVSSTAHAAAMGDRSWRDLLTAHHDLVRRNLQVYSGREINTTGDGFLAVFDGPAHAVRCALAIRRAVEPLGIQIRAGLHAGEIELITDDVTGIAVHIAARVLTLAEPGQVLVSDAVLPLLAGSGLSFETRGVHALKGVPGQWGVHAATG
jgi:class 3 adenylate cyclase